jgi:hypothetical protein
MERRQGSPLQDCVPNPAWCDRSGYVATLSADAGADEANDVDARDDGLVANTRSPDGHHPGTSATPEVVGDDGVSGTVAHTR